ncbi:hypothetical protein JOD67_004705 [Tenggerimyces flavus]|nr:hypothetical protein [Tenggerimyces flavus]MBM7788025.1 hypothetical protein [Tenggerimyces flavus]
MFGSRRLPGADGDERQRRAGERGDLDQDHVRGTGDAHQPTAQAWTGDLAGRADRLEGRVAREQVGGAHYRGQVRLVRDVEEHAREPDHDRDGEQQLDGQRVQGRRDRDREQGRGADEVGHDQDRSTRQAVDPGAGWQPDQREGDRPRRGEQAGFPWARVQGENGEKRNRDGTDLGTELAGHLSEQEQQNVTAAKQGGGGHRRAPRVRRNPTPSLRGGRRYPPLPGDVNRSRRPPRRP